MKSRENLTEFLHVRLRLSEYERLHRTARHSGMSASGLIRRALWLVLSQASNGKDDADQICREMISQK